MKFLLIFIVLLNLFTIRIVSSGSCTVTCLVPIKVNFTTDCSNGMWAFSICFNSSLSYSTFCAKPGFVFNATDPSIISWTVCY